MNLNKFTHTQTGKIIMSVLLGFGLATIMFRKVCKGKNCLKFKVPDNDYIKKTTFTHGDKCYNFFSHTVDCKNSKMYVTP